jgi:hypothetical protein
MRDDLDVEDIDQELVQRMIDGEWAPFTPSREKQTGLMGD